MNIPPLAIVQARIHSTRLPNKMLLPLKGKPLVWHAWDRANMAFSADNVILACPSGDAEKFREILPEAIIFGWDGDENDVLGRFYCCAHRYRWHPESIIVRVTPDDPFKDVTAMRSTAFYGKRYAVELGAEAFTLRQLDRAHWTKANEAFSREHMTYALFGVDAPPKPEIGGPWTIDTLEDYEAAKRKVGDV